MEKTYKIIHPTKTPDNTKQYLDNLKKMNHVECHEEAKRLYGALLHIEGIIDEGEDQEGKLQNFVKVVLLRHEDGPEYFNREG